MLIFKPFYRNTICMIWSIQSMHFIAKNLWWLFRSLFFFLAFYNVCFLFVLLEWYGTSASVLVHHRYNFQFNSLSAKPPTSHISASSIFILQSWIFILQYSYYKMDVKWYGQYFNSSIRVMVHFELPTIHTIYIYILRRNIIR